MVEHFILASTTGVQGFYRVTGHHLENDMVSSLLSVERSDAVDIDTFMSFQCGSADTPVQLN